MRHLVAVVLLTIFAVVVVVIVFAASAEPTASDARRAIVGAGHRCDAVAGVRPGARIDDGSVLLIIDCTNGPSHVVKLAGDSVRYYADCAAWLNPVRCN